MRAVKMLCVAVAAVLSACGPKVASIEISPNPVTLAKKGDVANLVATPKDAAGKPVENTQVTFAVADAAVASVDSLTGKVTALKTGTTEVTATFQKVSASVPVKVTIPASISLAPAAVELKGLGQAAPVTAKLLDEKGEEMKGEFTWESADTKIAEVKNGEITSVGAGETVVTVKAGGQSAQVKVVVALPAAAAVEAEKALELKAGDAPVKVNAVAKDAEGKEIAGAPFTYAIDNAKVATVDAAGMVTPVGKGKAKLTIASGEQSATVEITVKK